MLTTERIHLQTFHRDPGQRLSHMTMITSLFFAHRAELLESQQKVVGIKEHSVI
jgi:hypothetical protein